MRALSDFQGPDGADDAQLVTDTGPGRVELRREHPATLRRALGNEPLRRAGPEATCDDLAERVGYQAEQGIQGHAEVVRRGERDHVHLVTRVDPGGGGLADLHRPVVPDGRGTRRAGVD